MTAAMRLDVGVLRVLLLVLLLQGPLRAQRYETHPPSIDSLTPLRALAPAIRNPQPRSFFVSHYLRPNSASSCPAGTSREAAPRACPRPTVRHQPATSPLPSSPPRPRPGRPLRRAIPILRELRELPDRDLPGASRARGRLSLGDSAPGELGCPLRSVARRPPPAAELLRRLLLHELPGG